MPKSIAFRKDSAFFQYLPLYLVGFLCFLLVVAASFWVNKSERERVYYEFERMALNYCENLQRAVETRFDTFRDAGIFCTVSRDITHQEFRKFVLRELLDKPDIRGLGWVPRVNSTAREAFEEKTRRLFSSFQISLLDSEGLLSPAKMKPVYFPLLYWEPSSHAGSAFRGLDLSSEPVFSQAMVSSRRDRMPTAVDASELGKVIGGDYGLLMLYPAILSVETEESQDDSGRLLRGYVFGLVDVAEMIERLISHLGMHTMMQVLVFDPQRPQLPAILFESGKAPVEVPQGIGLEPTGTSGVKLSAVLNLGGHPWTLEFLPNQEFWAQHKFGEAWLIVAGGLSVTSVLFAYLFMGVRRSTQIERLVSERMAELAMANQGLAVEINDRKRAEENLRQANEELLRNQMKLKSVNEELISNEKKLRQTLAELEQTNTELQNTQLQLIESEKLELVGRLAAGLAHEVKHPLSVLLMGTEYVKKEISGEKVNKDELEIMLDDMIVATKRADSIIMGLLDFARASTISMLPENIEDILQHCLLLLKHDFHRNEIQVSTELDAALPEIVVDRTRLEQVFINLIANAVHAMPAGGKLKVRVYKEASEGRERLVVTIEDTGTGIPDDLLSKVFEPFFTTRSESGGSGLGLSIVRNIVEMHHGKISLSNRTEGGACARVVLPIRPS